jgi:hypothetical protein
MITALWRYTRGCTAKWNHLYSCRLMIRLDPAQGFTAPQTSSQRECVPLLASEVQLADACKLELPMRPDSAHDSSRRVCLSVGSQIKMADLVNHGRAKDHFGVGPLAFGDLIDHRIKDVYALNSALRRITVSRETTQADVTVYLADSGGGSVAAYKSSSPATLTPVGGCFTGIRRPLCLFDSSCRYELRSRCSDSVSALQYKGRIAD